MSAVLLPKAKNSNPQHSTLIFPLIFHFFRPLPFHFFYSIDSVIPAITVQSAVPVIYGRSEFQAAISSVRLTIPFLFVYITAHRGANQWIVIASVRVAEAGKTARSIHH